MRGLCHSGSVDELGPLQTFKNVRRQLAPWVLTDLAGPLSFSTPPKRPWWLYRGGLWKRKLPSLEVWVSVLFQPVDRWFSQMIRMHLCADTPCFHLVGVYANAWTKTGWCELVRSPKSHSFNDLGQLISGLTVNWMPPVKREAWKMGWSTGLNIATTQTQKVRNQCFSNNTWS